MIRQLLIKKKKEKNKKVSREETEIHHLVLIRWRKLQYCRLNPEVSK